jgi:hypothetical protein
VKAADASSHHDLHVFDEFGRLQIASAGFQQIVHSPDQRVNAGEYLLGKFNKFYNHRKELASM